MTNPPSNALPPEEAWRAYYRGEYPGFFGLEVQRLCQEGEWICWARPGRRQTLIGPWLPDTRWVLLPANIWPYLKTDFNHLRREEVRSEQKRISHPQINGGRPVFVEEERVHIVEMWFDPRFAPAMTVAPTRGHHERVVFATIIETWFRDEYVPAFRGRRLPNRGEMLKDVRDKWGNDVPETLVRKLKAKHAPAKAGRKKSGCY